MIVDTSAVIAVVCSETQATHVLGRLAVTPLRRISAASLLETYMVGDRSAVPDAVSELRQSLDRTRLSLASSR
jgi:uncharacterized protein with PIN domain